MEQCLQAVPGFDAKGIETVRRDTCPAVAKTMERSLRLLFATRDLSEVVPCPVLTPPSLCPLFLSPFLFPLPSLPKQRVLMSSHLVVQLTVCVLTPLNTDRLGVLTHFNTSTLPMLTYLSPVVWIAGERVPGKAVAQNPGQPSVSTGLCVCQGGAAGHLLPEGCSGSPGCHCGGQGHGHRPQSRAPLC